MLDSILHKVRSLLAKANDSAATEAEAESYTAKATELMAKHSIDEALLASSKKDDRVVITELVKITGSYRQEQRSLWHHVGLAFSAYTVGARSVSGSKDTDLVHLFGTQSAIEMTKLLVTSILVQAAAGTQRINASTVSTSPRTWWGDPESPKTVVIRERKAYLIGFFLAAGKRVQEQHQQEVDKTPGVGLVLVSDLKRAKDTGRDTFGKKLRNEPARSYDAGAKERGFNDGQRANVGARAVGDRSGVRALTV